MPIATATPAEIKRITAQGRRAAGRRSLTQWNDRWRQRRNQRTTQRRRPK